MPGLVDQLLQRLPDVQLLEHRAERRVVEVDLEVVDAVGVVRRQRVSRCRAGRSDGSGLAPGDLRQVLRRDVADVELAGLQRGVLGGVIGVRVVRERRELRLRAPE